MINTVLFDLDGTLLQVSQNEFVSAYFAELKKVFIDLGLDAELAIKAVWAGTKNMTTNDGTKLNSERFWDTFMNIMGLNDIEGIKKACDKFYTNEFDTVKSVLKNKDSDLPVRLISILTAKGFDIVLATNPLFPTGGVATRLRWIGLVPQDFCFITDYSNSKYCKPNQGYFREIFRKINKEPCQCLMVGNNVIEDMSIGALGADTFLVTDYLENENHLDISAFRNGTLLELEAYLTSLPSIKDV